MAEYSVEINSIAQAHITGCLGAALATYRGHKYRVPLGGHSASNFPTRDGHPCGVDVLPAAVYSFAAKQYDSLLKEYCYRSTK